MQNIYAILAKYNLTIPEDKKAEFEEAVKANYKTVAEVEKITSARDNYKTQLETAHHFKMRNKHKRKCANHR